MLTRHTKDTYPDVHKKNRKKLSSKRILTITAAVLCIISLILSNRMGINFIFVFLSLIVLTLCIFTFLYIRTTGYRRKERVSKSKKHVDNHLKIESLRKTIHVMANSEDGLKKLEKSNFNWTEKDILRNPKKTARPLEKAKDEKKPEQKPKFIPYRSPFEPINPPRTVTQEPDEKEKTQVLENTVDHAACTEASGETRDVQDPPIEWKDEITAVRQAEVVSTVIGTEMHEAAAILEMSPECLQSADITEDQDQSVELMNDEVISSSLQEAKERRTVKLVLKAKSRASFERDEPVRAEKASVTLGAQQKLVLPGLELLKSNNLESKEWNSEYDNEDNAKKLIDTLASFGVGAKVMNISYGPSVTRYEIQPNAGVKVSKIVNLADDIALNLAATGVRIEAPIPGKAAVGIEVPNKEVVPVLLRDVIESEEFKNHPSKLAFAVGKDVAGNIVIGDIAKMPHLLIAGATGSGKSVCINTLITSILYKAAPSEVRLLMVDPKVVELGIYNGIPHLLIPVVTDPKKAAGALNWAVQEMVIRYKLFADNNVRDLKGYNMLIREKGEGAILPQIVIIIDELADLMMVAPNEVEDCICRLAQMARAAGMHLVIATQRPSVDVITGVIKANIPSRISFAVSSQIDSRTILDMAGAEKLLGRGDMLYNPIGEPKPVRVQGGFISDKEVETVVTHIKSTVTAEYDEEIMAKINSTAEVGKSESKDDDDELLPQAVDIVIEQGQASVSLIQRKLKVGYSRAARILDQMEAWGIVSGYDGSKPRQILVTKAEWEELNA